MIRESHAAPKFSTKHNRLMYCQEKNFIHKKEKKKQKKNSRLVKIWLHNSSSKYTIMHSFYTRYRELTRDYSSSNMTKVGMVERIMHLQRNNSFVWSWWHNLNKPHTNSDLGNRKRNTTAAKILNRWLRITDYNNL